jgi:phage terminase small subunit
MSILDKPRHERLAQELALGTNQTDAYERAGYARDDGHASRLAGDGRIKARVREIQTEAAKHVALSRADMIEMMISDHDEARANKQMSAAIRAAELLSRELHGMYIERREVTTRDDVRALTNAELYEQLAQQIEALGEPAFAAKIRRMAQS